MKNKKLVVLFVILLTCILVIASLRDIIIYEYNEVPIKQDVINTCKYYLDEESCDIVDYDDIDYSKCDSKIPTNLLKNPFYSEFLNTYKRSKICFPEYRYNINYKFECYDQDKHVNNNFKGDIHWILKDRFEKPICLKLTTPLSDLVKSINNDYDLEYELYLRDQNIHKILGILILFVLSILVFCVVFWLKKVYINLVKPIDGGYIPLKFGFIMSCMFIPTEYYKAFLHRKSDYDIAYLDNDEVKMHSKIYKYVNLFLKIWYSILSLGIIIIPAIKNINDYLLK